MCSKIGDYFCMKFTPVTLSIFGVFILQENIGELSLILCLACIRVLTEAMSAVPQGAFLAHKLRQREKIKLDDDKGGNFYKKTYNMRNPQKYNSKLMVSIWNMYNRYSVHNLKKNYEKFSYFVNFGGPYQLYAATNLYYKLV